MDIRDRFWLYVLFAILIGMFALVCLSWGHGEGRCFTSASRNGGWAKVEGHLPDDKLKGYKHGHRNQYYDRNGNKTNPSTSFFDVDFDNNNAHDDFYVDCSTLLPSPRPVTPHPTPDPDPVTPSSTTTPQITPIEAAYPSSTGPESHFWDFSEGDSRFIGLPVLPLGVETVKDLWKAFRAEFKNDISFQLMANSVWQTSYRGEDNELGETAVTPHLGINVGINSWVTLRGVPVAGEEIELERGVHFVGLPEIPSLYKRPSDLLSNNVAWVHVKKDRKYPYIYAEGDDGDDLFYVGQAFVIRVMEALTLDLRGEVAAAPMAQRIGTLATSWGAMKAQ